jgi:ABC-type sugar transport system substrate-binding protein
MRRLHPLAQRFGVGLLLAGVVFALLALGFGGKAAQQLEQAQQGQVAQHQLEAAWRQVQRAGSYDFATQLTQTLVPAPSITTVGQAPQVEAAYIQGRADLIRAAWI